MSISKAANTGVQQRKRKVMYSPAAVEAVCEALRAGATYRLAAHVAGINESTLYRWSHLHPEFAARMAQVSAEAAVGWLQTIDAAAAAGEWQAAAWKLERRYPAEYGRRVMIDLEARIRAEAEAQGLDPDDAVAEAQRILARS